MSEPVRLVVWDLDETFWRGTLTEGGISEYVHAHHDIVIELARRGILSSICSKNDLAAARHVLEAEKIWEYFVFPSIDWSSKGPRLHRLIEDMQLRPASVLFIDDNPSNLAEAEAMVPGIQVRSEACIADLLGDVALRGKDDSALQRLKQYKVLEARKAEQAVAVASGSNAEFLRASEISVTIEHDVDSNIDRAIELVNRTNQLNFTKQRLPDSQDDARSALRAQLSALSYARRTGLIHVKDKYGDYGYCGFYLTEQLHEWYFVIHLCFSCRILGMGVEQWVYQKLGRPDLTVQGEVISDIYDPTPVDWINAEPVGSTDETTAALPKHIRNIFLRGSCELDAVGHYLRYVCDNLSTETTIVRNENLIRRDSLVNICAGIDGLTEHETASVEALGISREYFTNSFLTASSPGDVIVLSLSAEAMVDVYRRKPRSGDVSGARELTVLMQLRGLFCNYVRETDEGLGLALDGPGWPQDVRDQAVGWLAHLRREYDAVDLSLAEMTRCVHKVFSHITAGVLAIVLMPSFKYREDEEKLNFRALRLREALKSQAKAFPNVRLIDIMDAVETEDEFVDRDHISRMGYFRLSQLIMRALTDFDDAMSEVSSDAHGFVEGVSRGRPLESVLVGPR